MSELIATFENEILDVVLNPENLSVSFIEDFLNVTTTSDGLEVEFVSDVLDVTIDGDLEVTFENEIENVNFGEIVEITNNYATDTVGIIAAENLGGHRIVTVDGYYASKDTETDKFKVLGMTTGAASITAEATVQISGFIEEPSWNWTVGTPVFLSANGLLTQTVPTSGYRQIVGKPKTATILFIEISEPIVI